MVEKRKRNVRPPCHKERGEEERSFVHAALKTDGVASCGSKFRGGECRKRNILV